MNKKNRFSWLVKPKGFIRLVGAEYELMVKAGTNVLLKFYFSSVIIMCILVISFLAIRYAIDLLFHKELVEILLSVFFSLLFVFIYIFLLNTFTKKETNSLNGFFKLSNFIRVAFVIFMAFMISKPIELFVYREVLESEVYQHKQQVLAEHQARIDAMFFDDLKRLFDKADYYQAVSPQTSSLQPELEAVKTKIQEIKDRKDRIMQVAQQRVQTSSFFIFRIQQLAHHHPFSYLVCLCITALFMLPGFIIYSISKDDAYYKLKTEYEESLINTTYAAFSHQYRRLALQQFGKEIDFYTVFEDPPFNTKRKPGKQFQPQTEFFKKYS